MSAFSHLEHFLTTFAVKLKSKWEIVHTLLLLPSLQWFCFLCLGNRTTGKDNKIRKIAEIQRLRQQWQACSWVAIILRLPDDAESHRESG